MWSFGDWYSEDQNTDGVEKVLQQVRYIPGLKRNLISLGTLDVKGYLYKAFGGMLKVSKGCSWWLKD